MWIVSLEWPVPGPFLWTISRGWRPTAVDNGALQMTHEREMFFFFSSNRNWDQPLILVYNEAVPPKEKGNNSQKRADGTVTFVCIFWEISRWRIFRRKTDMKTLQINRKRTTTLPVPLTSTAVYYSKLSVIDRSVWRNSFVAICSFDRNRSL